MRQLLCVFRKELVDNIRDRRSLFFALLYGPILLPLMMIGPMAMGISKYTVDTDYSRVVHMISPERVPNLVQFFLEQNILVKEAPENYKQQVIDQSIDVVLELSAEYERALRDGKSASIRVYLNQRSDESEKSFRMLSSVVYKYNQSLATLRLDLRGLDASFLSPIYILDEDLGKVDQGAKAISMVLPFIFILSLTMGGFYLAVDSTAGERERHSLEPLLSLRISRSVLVFGKLLALMVFVSTSALLALTSCFLLFKFIPVKALSSLVQVELSTFGLIFLFCLPLVPFFSTAMMMIAAYAKNTKEAQTHLGLSMMLPMAPFFLIQFGNMQSSDTLAWVPIMGQFFLVETVFSEGRIELIPALKSGCSAILGAAIFLIAILKLYNRERILAS